MLDKVGGRPHQIMQPITNQHEKTARSNQINGNQRVNKDPELSTSFVKREEMEKIVQGMNDFLKPSSTHLKFEFHDELKEYYVSIVDDVTHEVVKEIPAKKMLDMYAAMTDFLGILVDKKI